MFVGLESGAGFTCHLALCWVLPVPQFASAPHLFSIRTLYIWISGLARKCVSFLNKSKWNLRKTTKLCPAKVFIWRKKSDFWAKGKLCSGCAFCFLINLSRYWNLFVILLFCLVLFWYRDIERGMPDEILCCIHFWLNFQFAILPFPFCAISRRQIRDWEGAK